MADYTTQTILCLIFKCKFTNYCNILETKIILRRVWRYQGGNQNPYIEEEQTTQWSKEKV
jgi:hypothetical protein